MADDKGIQGFRVSRWWWEVKGKCGMKEREEGRKEKHYLPIYLPTYLSLHS
jgi:hypothetical protein